MKVGSDQVRGRAKKAIQVRFKLTGSNNAPAILVSVENGERQGFKLGG